MSHIKLSNFELCN